MLRIGDFARLGRVTVKALRHYDDAGLLRPAAVDAATGYRAYRPDQLPRLMRVVQLKDLGFTLAEIRALLDAPHRLEAALRARRAALDVELAATRARRGRLDALLEQLAAAPGDPGVVVTSLPPQRARCARERVGRRSRRITALFETLEAEVARARARAPRSPFLLTGNGRATPRRTHRAPPRR